MSSTTYFKRATALYSRSHNVTLYDSAEADPAAGRTPKLHSGATDGAGQAWQSVGPQADTELGEADRRRL